MKAIKKVLTVLLAGVMMFSFVACSSNDDNDGGSGTSNSTSSIINPNQVWQVTYGCLIDITPEKPAAGATVTVKASLGKITSIKAKKVRYC